MDWLIEVQKHHQQWITIVKTFGAGEFSEDIVQDVYIRLAERSSKEKVLPKGKLNSGYVFFALRNTYIDWYRKQRGCTDKNRFNFVHFEDYEKANNLYIMWLKDENNFENVKIKENKHAIILDKINEEINTWHWYDQMLFKEYVTTGKSIITLAKESNISRSSIFQTLKNCKQRIKITVGEDWEDFRNQDFEHIKP
jgi:RNA polymerase sigma factor (sigma-70 family)